MGKMIRNTTKLRELSLYYVNMSSVTPHSLSYLNNVSSSLISLSLGSTSLQGDITNTILCLENLKLLILGGNKNIEVQLSKLNWSSLKGLDLRDCQFEGHFPLSFKNLTQLIGLDISLNKFIGEVSFFSSLNRLYYLNLSNNGFSGQIPSSLSNSEYISIVDVSKNNFSSEIPDVFGKLNDLQYLALNNNKFSGGISILFCNATSLEILNLSHNKLSGPIPQCLVGIPNLSVLDLQMNAFFGTLPDNFSKSSVLQTLHFNSNKLMGSLPQSLAHCNRLEIFYVGHNEIWDTFPSWLDGLPELQVLILRDNRFHGAIYGSNNTKHPFSKIRIFDLSNNHFHESLPTTYIKGFKGMMKTHNVEAGSQYMGSQNFSTYKDSVIITWKGYSIELERILTIFTTIDLSNNRFDGEIPNVIGELHALIGFNISHNRITGSIPESIGKLTNLEWLDLSCNKLEGEIPQAMTNLNFLAVLNLSQNQFVGPIPRGEQFDTFQNDSYKGNLGLCGVPLTKMCKKDGGESTLPIFDSEKKFGFGWKPVALGYGCGMVFGIFMGYVMFSIRKPQGFVRTFEGQSKIQANRKRNRVHAN